VKLFFSEEIAAAEMESAILPATTTTISGA